MTDTKKDPAFDKEEYYDDVVQPLIKMARELCHAQGIPLFFTACFKRDTDGVHFASGGCPGEDNWVPNEFRMIRAIVQNEATLIPLGPLVGEALKGMLAEKTKGDDTL